MARTMNANGNHQTVVRTPSTPISPLSSQTAFEILSPHRPMTFTQQTTDNFASDSPPYGINAGTRGGVAFTSQQACVPGGLSACSGSGFYQQDTAVETCGPWTNQGGLQHAYFQDGVERSATSSRLLALSAGKVAKCGWNWKEGG